MEVVIQEIDPENTGDVNRCEGVFSTAQRIVPRMEAGEIRYAVVATQGGTKRYPPEALDLPDILADPDWTIFLAYVEGQVAGQIVLRRNWNRYGYIQDIVVDRNFRRRGVGGALMAEAKAWAQDCSLAGLMLETQDNNVGACMFYEACGFRLGGLDSYLYKGIDPHRNEAALFWYLLFKRD